MIEVSMKCPCGTAATVDVTPARAEHRWSCHCQRCYDGTEDSGSLSLLVGYGATPEQAIAAWWDLVENAWAINYLPNTLLVELSEQVGDESNRQSGWIKVFSRAIEHASMPLASRPVWYLPYEGRVQ